MTSTLRRRALLASIALFVGLADVAGAQQPRSNRYADLVALFSEWRQFQRPKSVNGAPDYSAAAMAAQQRALPALQRRLTSIDTAGWTRAQKVDWHIVRAEMNGLDFDHRVLKPWVQNPAFYVTVFPSRSDQPAREGPHAEGSIELWSYTFPLSTAAAAEISAGLRAIPTLLRQARTNLTGNAKDLWVMGVRSVREQSAALETFATRVADRPELVAEAARARAATDEFATWLESVASSKTGPSGIGIANYDWYLKNVQLVNMTWQEQVTLMQRELDRSRASLALEEHRNRTLPAHALVADSAEWRRRFQESVTEYITFLRDRQILTVKPYMDTALRARQGRFSPTGREFFTEVQHRDPIIMRTHDFHWIDLAQAVSEPHGSPIRRGPLLYNIFITRTEGLATAIEEIATLAGLLDNHARGKELIYILVAQRAARALGDLMMHANRWTLDQSVQWVSAQTPRNWLKLDGRTVWFEQHLYLQQPAYGTSYLIGKIEIDRMIGDRAHQLRERFSLRQFFDEFLATGMIPWSLVRYELMGEMN